MYQKWQKVLFQSLINELLSKIRDSSLDWFQFSLIVREGNIKFRGLNQQLKFRKFFQDKRFVDKNSLKNSIILCETLVSNNKKVLYFIHQNIHSVIKMKQSQQSLNHKPIKCFTWWKEFMTKKYGPDLKWFDAIAFKKDTFKIKSFDFKQNLNRILSCTEHKKCAQKICSFFPKNQKNQIQFSIFMNTIKVSSQTFYQQNSPSKRSQSHISQIHYQSILKFSQKQTIQKTQRAVTQTSQACYESQQKFWSPGQEKLQRRQNNHMRNRFFKKSIPKSYNTFYSVPVKETVQRQKSQSIYQNWIDNVQI